MKKKATIIGRVEAVDFPKLGVMSIPARVDTGAKTSSVWASKITLNEDNTLSFYLFGKKSQFYVKKKITVRSYEKTVVSSSTGVAQVRYKVKLGVVLNGMKMRASFTLANRSRQVYPVLIGRNILKGRFIVDVLKGKPMLKAERERTEQLRQLLD